jgi:hypothetical protein
MPNPAQELISSVRGTATATTSSEFKANLPNGARSKTLLKLPTSIAVGTISRVLGNAEPGGRNAAKTIQSMGRRKISTMATWTTDLALTLEDKGFICGPDIPLSGNDIKRNNDKPG